MKFKIQLTDPENKHFLSEKEVDGESIVLDGFEEFDFFIYQDDYAGFFEPFHEFIISELTTGCKVGGGISVNDAKIDALNNIGGIGSDKFRELVQHVINLRNEQNPNPTAG